MKSTAKTDNTVIMQIISGTFLFVNFEKFGISSDRPFKSKYEKTNTIKAKGKLT